MERAKYEFDLGAASSNFYENRKALTWIAAIILMSRRKSAVWRERLQTRFVASSRLASATVVQS
jgi:hypothetical protein